ncbi:TetR/AcrR family transcriptional regulator [Levilinea saccharolytica]|nr:TetR/AcrR family transcriptional regulator [Levilinea saccharolytica]
MTEYIVSKKEKHMPRTKTQTEQIRAESQAKIIATARRLFAERGYDGCTVSEIAKQAGMSQGNIYWHFPSKEAIFQAVLMEGFQAIGGTMSEAVKSAGNGLEKFNRFLGDFLALSREKGADEFISIMITFLAQGGVAKFAEFGISSEQIGAGYHQTMNAIFAQGQADGSFRSDLEPNLLTTFYFSFINGLMLMYPHEWRDIPDDVIREALLRLLGGK